MSSRKTLNSDPTENQLEIEEIIESTEPEKVEFISLDRLDPFCNHPFQVRDDEEMEKMAESIKKFGVLNPAIARPKLNDRYELVSGHRRRRACELAGLREMPVIIRSMSDDEAILCMVDSNMQRRQLLPSEKAKAYKMKMDALNRQGKRHDLTSSQVGTKLRSDEIISHETGESRNQVQRYVRLTELIPELLQMVDDGRISMGPAYEISFLSDEEQQFMYDGMEAQDAVPSLAQARELKFLSQKGILDEDAVSAILRQQKGNQKEKIKIPRERFDAYTVK